MERIAIIGSAGSRKSTLTIDLAQITHLPLYHLDRIFWKPGWRQTPKEEFIKNQMKIIENKLWIIDGNYSNTMDNRLEKADTIIFLDFSRIICVWRVIKRRFQYGNKDRPDITEGCYERIEIEFLKWIWNYPKRSRSKVLKKISKLNKTKKIFHLHNPREVKNFLRSFSLK